MFLLYLFLWLVFVSHFSFESAAAGAAISIAVYIFTRKHMRYKSIDIRRLLRSILYGLHYAVILLYEIGIANAAVFRIVFSRKINVNPRLIYFRTALRTTPTQVVLANSITLTPGTITVALNNGLFCVHCLNEKMAEGIESSSMVRQLMKFEQ